MLKMIRHVLAGGSCKSTNAFLLDYVEGRLEPTTAERFEEHVNMCPNCRHYLDQYRETIALVREVPPPPVPPELEERTCRFISEALGIGPPPDA